MSTSVSDKVASLYDRYVAWHPDHQRGPVKSVRDLQSDLQSFIGQASDLGEPDPRTTDQTLLCFTMDEVDFLISREAWLHSA